MKQEKQEEQKWKETAVSTCHNPAAKVKTIERALLLEIVKQEAWPAKEKARIEDAGPEQPKQVSKDTSDKASVGGHLSFRGGAPMGGAHSTIVSKTASEVAGPETTTRVTRAILVLVQRPSKPPTRKTANHSTRAGAPLDKVGSPEMGSDVPLLPNLSVRSYSIISCTALVLPAHWNLVVVPGPQHGCNRTTFTAQIQ